MLEASIALPYAPPEVHDYALRFFVQPFTDAARPLAWQFGRIADQGPWKLIDAQQLDLAYRMLDTVSELLDPLDATRITKMAIATHLSELAILCGERGLLFPWREHASFFEHQIQSCSPKHSMRRRTFERLLDYALSAHTLATQERLGLQWALRQGKGGHGQKETTEGSQDPLTSSGSMGAINNPIADERVEGDFRKAKRL